MKVKYIIATALLGLCLYSCSNIPNKSIFEPLTTDELSKVIKKDTSFIEFYEAQRKISEKLNEIDKAKFADLTYRRLFKMYQYIQDTAIMVPIAQEWSAQWETLFGPYYNRADSVITYWTKYKNDNSLNKFINIEFAELNKEYYTYSYDVKKVSLGFRLTALQGPVEQVMFNYKYSAKISDFYGEKHNCILTAPFENSILRYWEVEYSDEKRLKNSSTTEFARDYDIEIEITNVRKDGINYSLDDLKIPEPVLKVMKTDSAKYPYLYLSYKEDMIKTTLYPSYKSSNEFRLEKFEQLMKDKFPEEYAYVDYISTKY